MSIEMLLIKKKKSKPVASMTYPQFQDWLKANSAKVTADTATATPQSRYQTPSYGYANMPAAPAQTMWGSPYKGLFTHDSPIARIMQHAIPPAVYEEIRANTRICMFRFLDYNTYPNYVSVTRNGFTSNNYTSFRGYHCNDFVYYDATKGIMMRYNPLTDNTPVAFDGTLLPSTS
jgi:hypothetical protein